MSTDNNTSQNHNPHSTERDVWSHSTPSSSPAHASAADAAAARQEREQLVEWGRQRDAEAKRLANLPPVARQVDIMSMVPPEHRGSIAAANAYLDAMAARGNDNRRRHMSSENVGALPIDNSILSDPRSPYGAPRAVSALTPDCTVTFRGVRISIEQAVREGLLEVDDRGRYSVPNEAAREAQQRQQQQKQAEQQAAQIEAARAIGDEPDADAQSAIERVNHFVPPQAVEACIQDYLKHEGTISSENINKIAAARGLTSEQAHAMAHSVVNGLQRQARTATVHAGVPAAEVEACWAWAQQSDPIEYAQALSAFLRGSDTRGLKAAAKRYLGSKRPALR